MKKLIILVTVLLVVVFAGILLTREADEVYQLKYKNTGKEETLTIRYVNAPVVDFFAAKSGERNIVAKFFKEKKFNYKGKINKTEIYLFKIDESIDKNIDEKGRIVEIRYETIINRYTKEGNTKVWFVFGPEEDIIDEVNKSLEENYGLFTCKKLERQF